MHFIRRAGILRPKIEFDALQVGLPRKKHVKISKEDAHDVALAVASAAVGLGCMGMSFSY